MRSFSQGSAAGHTCRQVYNGRNARQIYTSKAATASGTQPRFPVRRGQASAPPQTGIAV